MSAIVFQTRSYLPVLWLAAGIVVCLGPTGDSACAQGFSISVPFFQMHSDPVHGTYWSAPFASGHGPPIHRYPPGLRYHDDVYEDQREAWEEYQEDLEDYQEDLERNARRRSRRSFFGAPAYPPMSPGRQIASPNPASGARDLNGSAARLHRELSGISTGEGWKRYLNLGLLLRASAGQGDSLGAQAETQAELATALDRFADVAANPEYRVVAQLNGFAATREALAAYLAQASGEMPDAIGANRGDSPDAPADSEEIPTPQPVDPPAADVGPENLGRQVSGPLLNKP